CARAETLSPIDSSGYVAWFAYW
nr:immunoglobulin heavy chain junction region [Mus musculus]MBK4184175.1 immunoglobulin heavy chain junction region [Mus musculus]